MDRLKQIRGEVLTTFFKKHGRMPSESELTSLLNKKPIFSPLVEPMVPEEGAKSIADYTRLDLINLIKDRNLIDDLLTNLEEKIERVGAVSDAETAAILKSAEAFFTDTSENDYGVILNELPLLASEADVAEWYAVAAGTDDLYVQDDGTSSEPSYAAQWIELDSFNVDSSAAGISISPSVSEQLQVSLSIGAYSETDTSILQTLSKVNPISIIASGLEGINKGIEIAIPLLDKDISTIKLDTNAINCSVLVDGTQLFTKSLDGPSTLSIATNVKRELKLILFDSPTQVHVIVRDFSIFSSATDAAGGYSFGQYVTLQVPLRSDYANIKFNPDEYVPPGTNIEWEWSPSRIAWEPLSKDEDGMYNRLEWNTDLTNPSTISPISLDNGLSVIWKDTITGDSIEGLPTLYEYAVKQGKGCVLFVTKNIAAYQGFQFYLDVTDETGYTLEIANAATNSGINVLKHISISGGEDTNITSEVNTDLKFDLAFGIYKIDLQISDEIELEDYNFGDKTILKVLEDDFGAKLNLSLGADRLGRVADTWIQPYSLTPTDQHNMILHPIEEQINRASLLTHGPYASGSNFKSDYGIALKLLYSNDLYDVVPVDLTLYSTTEELHSGYELHYYSGEGDEDWLVNPYHTPVGDVTMNESGTAYTPAQDGSILVANSELATTRAVKKEYLEFAGDDPLLYFNLQEEPISGTLSLVYHNIVSDIGYPFAGTEDYPVFMPAGRGTQAFPQSGTWSEPEVFTLTYRPVIGYCLTDGEIEKFTRIQDDCNPSTSTWVTGYCSDGASITETDCGLEGFCDDTAYSDKAACETASQTWTSTYSWTDYIKFTDSTGANVYPIGFCSGGTATAEENREECQALADYGQAGGSSWADFDLDAKEVTVRDLNGLTNDVFCHYDWGELQNASAEVQHVQFYTVIAADDIVLLDRVPSTTAGTPIEVVPPESDSGQALAVTYDSGLDKYKVDLNNYNNTTLQEGDIITLKYQSTFVLANDGKELSISNSPSTITTRKTFREIGTTINPTSATTLTMLHPVAFREQPTTDNSNLIIEVNGSQYDGYCTGFSTNGTDPDSPQPTTKAACLTDPDGGGAGVAGTWHNVLIDITGNVLTMDLSQFAASDDSTQEIVTVVVNYETYDHTYPWKVEIEYDYYGKDPYTFNYAYNEVVPMSFEPNASHPVYNNTDLRDHFYDISIMKTKGDDLYLKATLTSSGEETPIIRRLRFER